MNKYFLTSSTERLRHSFETEECFDSAISVALKSFDVVENGTDVDSCECMFTAQLRATTYALSAVSSEIVTFVVSRPCRYEYS